MDNCRVHEKRSIEVTESYLSWITINLFVSITKHNPCRVESDSDYASFNVIWPMVTYISNGFKTLIQCGP